MRKNRPLTEKSENFAKQQNVILEERSKDSEEDDKTQEFYNDLTEDGEERMKLKTPIKSQNKNDSIEKEQRLLDPKPKKIKRENIKPQADDISNDILNMIPDLRKNKTKPIPSQRKEPQNNKYELNIEDGNITTQPIRSNNQELAENIVTTGQATFKSPNDDGDTRPKRRQLAKPGFAIKNK